MPRSTKRKKIHKCSQCEEPGHNKLTCPENVNISLKHNALGTPVSHLLNKTQKIIDRMDKATDSDLQFEFNGIKNTINETRSLTKLWDIFMNIRVIDDMVKVELRKELDK